MTAARSSTKTTPVKSKRPGREQQVAETTRTRKREALERFVNKNAKVLAELAK